MDKVRIDINDESLVGKTQTEITEIQETIEKINFTLSICDDSMSEQEIMDLLNDIDGVKSVYKMDAEDLETPNRTIN